MWRKLRYLLPSRRRAAEQDMREEMESLAAMASPGELRGQAMAMENARQEWRLTAFDGVWADVRYALRVIARQPAVAAVAAGSLGLGIGANCAIFSFADAILFRPLPVAEPSRLLAVAGATPTSRTENLSYPEVRDLRAGARSIRGVAAYHNDSGALSVSATAPAQSRLIVLANPEFFETLGVVPFYGSLGLPERQPVAVLAYDFWRTELGADPGAVGRTLRINGVEFAIGGVAPASFTGLDLLFRPALYVPLGMRSRLMGTAPDPLEDRERRDLGVKVRLAAGASEASAVTEVARVGDALARTYPQSRDRRLVATGERTFRMRQYAFRLAAIGSMGALTFIVLLIACANVANVLLARARVRGREMAIRLAIGAGRLRLVRQLLIESLAIAALGGAAGLLFARVVMRYLGTVQVSSDVPIFVDLRLDGRLLAFNAVLSVCACLLCGLSPALHAARTGLVAALKTGEEGGGRRGWFSSRAVSVAVQVGLALVLLTVAGAYLSASGTVVSDARGFRVDHRISLEVDTAAARYSAERSHTFYDRLRVAVRGMGGVRSVALCESLPYSPNQSAVGVAPEGYQLPAGKRSIGVFGGAVDENYFSTIGVTLVGGRGFTTADRAETRRVAVVNQEFARLYWAGANAVGRRLQVDGSGPWEVVGVARNGRYQAPTEGTLPYVYLPHTQRPRSRMTLVVETAGDPGRYAGPLRDLVRGLDPDLPVLNLRTLEAHEARTASNWFIFVNVLTGLGGMGVLLALGGVYGLVAYSVSRRTAEIGIRMAMGATPGQVVRLVLRQGMTPALVGAAVGAVLAAFLAPRIAIGVQNGAGVTATQACVVLLLLGACALACYLPARRAAGLAPSGALRHE